MSRLDRAKELAAERYGIEELTDSESAALNALFSGENAICFHRGDIDSRVFTELPGVVMEAPIVHVRPGPKAAFKKDCAIIVASPQQIDDDAWRKRVRECGPGLLVLENPQDYIEEWSPETFRTFYEELGKPTVLCLSMLASPYIRERLELFGINATEFFLDYFRDNLMFEVMQVTPGERKRRLAVRIAEELPGPGVFYTSSVRAAKELEQDFVESGLETALHHGQQRAPERQHAHRAFLGNQATYLIAAGYVDDEIAEHARFSVHVDLPERLDFYHYEASTTSGLERPSRTILLYERTNHERKLQEAEAKDPTPDDGKQAARALHGLYQFRAVPAPMTEIAEQAGIPAKKLRLLMNLLKDADLVEESKRGYFVPKWEEVPDDQSQSAVSKFRSLRDEERRRYRAVLNYAQSGMCRVKLLHRFFGLDDIEACGLCDNCRRGKEDSARAAAQKKRVPDTAGRPARAWARGDLVRHAAWGEGEVKQVWGDKLRIHFPGLGEKVVKAEFVHPPQ